MFIRSDNLILLVEDNPDDERLARRAIQKADSSSQTITAVDGEQALRFLVDGMQSEGIASDRVPDMVLLDLKLPKVNGLEVLEKLRMSERTQCVPVVVMSSSNHDSDVLNSYRLGANCYVQKPIDFQRYMEAVTGVVNFWLSGSCSVILPTGSCDVLKVKT